MAKSQAQAQPQFTAAQLKAQWEARVKSGKFSAGIEKVGTIRVFGKAGDAPVNYPIVSLAALDTLAPDEQWAVAQAQSIVREHAAHGRTVVAMQPGQPQATAPAKELDTMVDSYLVLNQIAGGSF